MRYVHGFASFGFAENRTAARLSPSMMNDAANARKNESWRASPEPQKKHAGHYGSGRDHAQQKSLDHTAIHSPKSGHITA